MQCSVEFQLFTSLLCLGGGWCASHALNAIEKSTKPSFHILTGLGIMVTCLLGVVISGCFFFSKDNFLFLCWLWRRPLCWLCSFRVQLANGAQLG